MADNTPQGKGLSFVMDNENSRLIAVFAPTEDKQPISWTWLEETLKTQGYDNLYFPKGTKEELLRLYNGSNDAFELPLAELKDGEFKIIVGADRLSASLTLVPPAGGKPVTMEAILADLKFQHISYGVDMTAVDEALAQQRCEDKLIARGIPAKNGRDGRLEALVSDVTVRVPRIDEKGIAHFRDLGGVPIVRQGEPLMRRHPPTDGEPGVNVLGQPIPPKPGRPVVFAANLAGTEIDPKNPDLLIASVAGQPVVKKDGVTVEPVIKVPEVSLTTGNITFEGSIKVNGDIKTGMTVIVSGDLHVNGTVEAAVIKAGGNVVIKGGLIGRGGSDDANEESIPQVKSQGSVSARFVENARIFAKESVYIDEYVLQSEISAGYQILVGKGKANKGSIVGGVTRARFFLQCHELGSRNQIPTLVEIGVDPYVRQRLREIEHSLDKAKEHLADVNKALSFLRLNPEKAREEMVAKATKTYDLLTAEIANLRKQRDQLKQELAMTENARIEVAGGIYPPLELNFGDKVKVIDVFRTGGTLRLKDNEIVLD